MAKAKPTGPLTHDEILTSIEAAGYAFELRVHDRLKSDGMDPVFGRRFEFDESGITREVDIVASCYGAFPEPNVGPVFFNIRPFIQARRLPGGAFIGFPAQSPGKAALSAMRSLAGGSPSWGILSPAYNHHGEMMAPVIDAFGDLNHAPYCEQWAVTRRGKEGEPRTDHDASTWDDLENTVRTCSWQSRSFTLYLLQREHTPGVNLYFNRPTLVLDAPLFTYDINARALTAVDRIILRVAIDGTQGGGVVEDVVDVVTMVGLADLCAGYRASSVAIEACLRERGGVHLALYARQQHETYNGR